MLTVSLNFFQNELTQRWEKQKLRHLKDAVWGKWWVTNNLIFYFLCINTNLSFLRRNMTDTNPAKQITQHCCFIIDITGAYASMSN